MPVGTLIDRIILHEGRAAEDLECKARHIRLSIKDLKLLKWISDRVLKLSCTADDMRPLAAAAGLDPPVHKWKPEERAQLMAELDAAYFLLYGLDRDDVQYILSTFAGAAEPDESTPSILRSDNLILAAFDRLEQQ